MLPLPHPLCSLFSARFRLPARYTRDQHLFHVEKALHVLQLEDVREELVGDEETRGIRCATHDDAPGAGAGGP